MLSLGGGLTFNRLKVDLRRGIGLMPGDEFRFNADGNDIGFNLGLRWQPQNSTPLVSVTSTTLHSI